MTVNRYTVAARAAAALVALIAGAASWEHISSLAIAAGERAWVGYAMPAAIDGLILVGVAAAFEDKREHRGVRMSAHLAIWVGVVATLAANVASAEPTWTARLVAIAAPVSFLLAIEVLTRTGRQQQPPEAGEPQAGGDAVRAAQAPRKRQTRAEPRGKSQSRRSTGDKVAAARSRHPRATQAELARRAGVSVRSVARHDPGQQQPEPESEPESSPDGRRHGQPPVLAQAGEPS